MKNRDKWIAVIFMLFIFTLPIVTVVRGFLPQSQEETLTQEQQELLDKNGTMQGGSMETVRIAPQKVLVSRQQNKSKHHGLLHCRIH